jgi:hypothetical protein
MRAIPSIGLRIERQLRAVPLLKRAPRADDLAQEPSGGSTTGCLTHGFINFSEQQQKTEPPRSDYESELDRCPVWKRFDPASGTKPHSPRNTDQEPNAERIQIAPSVAVHIVVTLDFEVARLGDLAPILARSAVMNTDLISDRSLYYLVLPERSAQITFLAKDLLHKQRVLERLSRSDMRREGFSIEEPHQRADREQVSMISHAISTAGNFMRVKSQERKERER